LPQFELPTPQVSPTVAWFRHGSFADGIMLTNDLGEWAWLTPNDFDAFLRGNIDAESELHELLSQRGFLREHLRTDVMIDVFRRKNRRLGVGARQHELLLDGMDIATLKAIVDFAMLSTSARLDFVLQGSLTEHASFLRSYVGEKNRYEGKVVRLVAMLNGPPDHATQQLIASERMDVIAVGNWQAAALQAVRDQLSHGRKITLRTALPSASEITSLPYESVHAVDLVPGSGDGAAYGALLSAMLEHKDVALVDAAERFAVTRADDGPGGVLRCSPGGAGLRAITWAATGVAYPSLLGAQLGAQGEAMFALGQVENITWDDLKGHATLRSLALASLLPCLPQTRDAWWAPYVGHDPVASWVSTGDLFPSPSDPRLAFERMATESLFRAMMGTDGETVTDTLSAWADLHNL